MEWKAVESSQIAAVGYDAETQTLGITFKPTRKQSEECCEGSTYHYANVAPELFAGLAGAISVGKFFGEHIKNNPAYPFTKVSR